MVPGLIDSHVHALGDGELSTTFTFYDYVFANPLTLSAGESYWASIGITQVGFAAEIGGVRDSLFGFTGYGVTPELSIAVGPGFRDVRYRCV